MKRTRFIMLFISLFMCAMSFATTKDTETTSSRIVVTVKEVNSAGNDLNSVLGPFYTADCHYGNVSYSMDHDGYAVYSEPGTIILCVGDYQEFYFARTITLNGTMVGFGAGTYTFPINTDTEIMIYYEDHYHVSK